MAYPHLALVLAIECDPEFALNFHALPTEATPALADGMAADLKRLAPGVEALGLAASGALYDIAQLLRPGFPLFATLVELYGREAQSKHTPQLIVFGDSGGTMADSILLPESNLMGSPLMYLPVVLLGDASARQRIGAHLENTLADQGLASAAIALHLSQALNTKVIHAQWLTVHDACALLASQLQSLGLDGAWAMLEAALFASNTDETAPLDEGIELRWRADGVHLALTQAEDWLHRVMQSPQAQEPVRLTRLRQTLDLLKAHRVPFTLVAES